MFALPWSSPRHDGALATRAPGSGKGQAVEEVRDIEKALLAYWRGNPSAAESLDSIARWWPMTSKDKIGKALQRLVERGDLEVEAVTSGRKLYRAGRG
jgi:hypothetical protein